MPSTILTVLHDLFVDNNDSYDDVLILRSIDQQCSIEYKIHSFFANGFFSKTANSHQKIYTQPPFEKNRT